LTGKEAALFVASGTMGNLISVMAHCRGRGEEILVGDQSHIIIWEQGGVAQVAGVHPRQVHTNCDGTLDLADIANKVRSPCDAHQPVSRLICVEQTHNATGGRVLSLDYLQKVRDFPLQLFCSVSHLKLITQIMLGENGLSPGVTYSRTSIIRTFSLVPFFS